MRRTMRHLTTLLDSSDLTSRSETVCAYMGGGVVDVWCVCVSVDVGVCVVGGGKGEEWCVCVVRVWEGGVGVDVDVGVDVHVHVHVHVHVDVDVDVDVDVHVHVDVGVGVCVEGRWRGTKLGRSGKGGGKGRWGS